MLGVALEAAAAHSESALLYAAAAADGAAGSSLPREARLNLQDWAAQVRALNSQTLMVGTTIFGAIGHDVHVQTVLRRLSILTSLSLPAARICWKHRVHPNPASAWSLRFAAA